ncbi:MAG: antibiotic biosynthesis monooxygenase [Rhodobacteraceae bacterium]|nr:antibiotic biosynthesis monooxygenase [Paracoccaceae bacterium]
MTFWSMLTTKVAADKADSSIAAFVKRRCIEESAETIPGFRHGELLQSTDDPGVLCVLCAWDDKSSYQQWLDSPLRAKQFPDLQSIMTGDLQSGMFESVHEVDKP